MTVAIAGAHGQIGLRLCRLLADDGVDVLGLVRNPDHVAELRDAGARGVVCDLEHASPDEVAAAVADADTVVVAAGAGPGSAAERKLTMDRDGAIALLRASADRAARYLMVSAVGAEDPPDDDAVFSVYLRAKAQADAAVAASDRPHTIVRPGRLLDDPGTGRIDLRTDPFRGSIPRDDIAGLLRALVAQPSALPRATVYVQGGETAIDAALAAV